MHTLRPFMWLSFMWVLLLLPRATGRICQILSQIFGQKNFEKPWFLDFPYFPCWGGAECFFQKNVKENVFRQNFSLFFSTYDEKGNSKKISNFSSRFRSTSVFETYGVDQPVSFTKLSENILHLSCGGYNVEIMACDREIAPPPKKVNPFLTFLTIIKNKRLIF